MPLYLNKIFIPLITFLIILVVTSSSGLWSSERCTTGPIGPIIIWMTSSSRR